mmetsp:Transcript_67735/g.209459  ORF Transcript_67735/g.209459 Transcript_67735/m.209459 type:complete len:241 (+) Transcript_67735:391-1113(+)
MLEEDAVGPCRRAQGLRTPRELGGGVDLLRGGLGGLKHPQEGLPQGFARLLLHEGDVQGLLQQAQRAAEQREGLQRGVLEPLLGQLLQGAGNPREVPAEAAGRGARGGPAPRPGRDRLLRRDDYEFLLLRAAAAARPGPSSWPRRPRHSSGGAGARGGAARRGGARCVAALPDGGCTSASTAPTRVLDFSFRNRGGTTPTGAGLQRRIRWAWRGCSTRRLRNQQSGHHLLRQNAGVGQRG